MRSNGNKRVIAPDPPSPTALAGTLNIDDCKSSVGCVVLIVEAPLLSMPMVVERRVEKDSREYGTKYQDKSPTMVRRHTSSSMGIDEEVGFETPPRGRKQFNAAHKTDQSKLSITMRRSWLKLRTSSSRSRWVTAISSVFFLGLLMGILETPHETEKELHQPYSKATLGPVQRMDSSLPEVTILSPFQSKPIMVEISRIDLSSVEAFDLRALSMPQIPTDDLPVDATYVLPYKPIERVKKGCTLMGDWQESHHPTCSFFHEIDMNQPLVEPHIGRSGDEQIRLVNNGAYRDVWMFRDWDGTQRALKTLRYQKKREFEPRNYERHRKDAVAVEALSGSPYIAGMFGYCGNSAFAEYSTGGDLYDLIDTEPSDIERLRVAYIVAASIADAHHLDSQGRATIAHTDIKPNQWIIIDGEYKLNDFNRARLLTWDKEENKHCGFHVERNAGMVS